MRVSDEIKNAVCFLCVMEGKKYTPVATAFFLSMPSISVPDEFHFYLVTAKHNLDEFQKLDRSIKRRGLHIAFNDDDGKRQHMALPSVHEWEDAGETADVAILSLDDLPDSLNVDSVRMDYCVTGFLLQKMGAADRDYRLLCAHLNKKPLSSVQLGIGDDIMVVGLYSPRAGNATNLPIVRQGIIAAMPDEIIIEKEAGREVRFLAYLVEVHSINGLSGSPVFVSLSPRRLGEQGEGRWLFLLGLVRGSWTQDVEVAAPLAQGGKAIETFKAGIAAVTPIQEALKLMFGSQEMKLRREEKERGAIDKKLSRFEQDSAFPKSSLDTNAAITPEGFEEALRRASRKLSD